MYRWELDDPAQQEFADLSPAARASLAAFMDAVVIVDPVQYQRRRGQAGELLLGRAVQLPPVHTSDAEPGLDLFPAHPPVRRRQIPVSVAVDAS